MGSAPVQRTGTITGIDAPSPTVRVVVVRVPADERFTFRAGQYATLTFAGQPPRDYSVASVPGEPDLVFHIRARGDQTVGGYVAAKLAVGDEVAVAGPSGDAFLRAGGAGPILAVGGGTGIVPILSIVETALGSGPPRPIHLYFGARDEDDLYLDPRFRALARAHASFRYVPVLSDAAGPTDRRTGLVSDAVAADFDSLAGFQGHVAGPPPMVAATSEVTERLGLNGADLHVDPFVPGDHHSAP